MTVVELIEQLELLNSNERLQVIESATRMIRRDLRPSDSDRESELRMAADAVKDLYEPGGPLSEWTALDGEEILDDYVAG